MKGPITQNQPDGYLVEPPSGKGEGILVLHAWWGLNETIKAVCRRLAQAGYVAFAPDLYHGKVADTIEDAERFSQVVDTNHTLTEKEVEEAAKYLSKHIGGAHSKLAVIAFSLGGYYALHLADADPDLIRSVVLFYGTDGTVGGDHISSRASYLGHFADNDPYETKQNVDTLEETLKRAGRAVTFYRYNGIGHWFFEPDRKDAYNEAASRLAWERTMAFLKDSTSKPGG